MVIQKILFPTENVLKKELFFRGLEEDDAKNQDSISIDKNKKITSNTYFNSFSIGKWKKYSNISSLELCIELQGEALIHIYGSKIQNGQVFTERITSMHTENVKREYQIDIDLNCGYICVFFEIYAYAAKVIFYGGGYTTKTLSERDIKIGIDICTYNRYEYLKKNIDLLTKNIIDNPESLLYNKMEVFVVDNANDHKTLQFQNKKIHVFLQNQKGSAGGFTRGMMEITQNKNFTHCVVMDDDVRLYPAVIERLYLFLKYLKSEYNDALIGGSLMRLDMPHIQHEAGALWNDGGVSSCKGNYNMLDYRLVVENEVEERTDYMGWWFCCIPIETIEKSGYPLPVYFHRDDVEYGLRNTKQITLNGICTWHKSFESKVSAVDEYYNVRNTGIILAIYQRKCYKYCYFVIKNILANLFLLKYNVVELMLQGVEDFMKGAEWVIHNDNGDYYNALKEKNFEERDASILEKIEIDENLLENKKKLDGKNKWIHNLLLNANFKKSHKVILVSSNCFDTSLFWNVGCAYYYNKYADKVFCCVKSRRIFWKSIGRMSKDMVCLLFRYTSLSSEWKWKKEEWIQKKFWGAFLETSYKNIKK